MNTESPLPNQSSPKGWVKYIAGICAGFVGLRAAVGEGAVCNMLADARWPGPDPRSMFIASSNCEKGDTFFWVLAAVAGYVTCRYLAERMGRPVSGVIAGLAAGALAGAMGAFIRFHNLYG